MSALYAVVGFIVVQRLAELAVATRNTRRLRARGAVEVGAGHYPAIVALHIAWLAAMLIAVAPETPAKLPLLAVFLALQAGRIWVIAVLGERWTTRIIVLPGAPRVARGPYRYVKHPNYLIVCAEIAVVPSIFGAWWIALLFSGLNMAMLWHRIRIEDAALAEAGKGC